MKMASTPQENKRWWPFRFVAAWMTYSNCQPFLKNYWERNQNWNHRVHNLQEGLCKWNKEVSRSIFKKKRKLLHDLERVSTQIHDHNTPHLERRLRDIWKKHQEVSRQKELLWFQRSRSKWLSYGDSNTRYFHGVTSIKRWKNTYEVIQNAYRNWVADFDALERLVIVYYCNLFTDDGPRSPSCVKGAFPPLSESQLEVFKRNVNVEDIYKAIFLMGNYKAPSRDGL